MALTQAQKTGLEAAILAYLAAEGGRFARTVAALKEEAQVGGGNDQANLVVSGAVMEKAWLFARRNVDEDIEDNCEEFFGAIAGGDLAEVQVYVCLGVDVETLRHKMFPDNDHDDDEDDEDILLEVSPLCQAAVFGQLEIVQHFLTTGHNMEEGYSTGRSPLFAAAEDNNIVVVQYLTQQGADKNKADCNGVIPLIVAAEKGFFTLVQYMVEQGADKDKADNYGCTPLMAACWKEHADVAEHLLDQGCDRDRTDDDGYTALHYAAWSGGLNVAQVLFRYGAKLDARNKHGETPVDIATSSGHHALADAIRAEEIRRLNHGFKRDRSTIEGTEEHEASKRPRIGVVAVAENDDEDDDDEDDDDDDDDDEDDDEEE